jgi:hypothetical protein
VAFVPLLQGIDHCSRIFFFSSFWLCAPVMPLGHYIIAKAAVIGIFAILIYTPYHKKMAKLAFSNIPKNLFFHKKYSLARYNCRIRLSSYKLDILQDFL